MKRRSVNRKPGSRWRMLVAACALGAFFGGLPTGAVAQTVDRFADASRLVAIGGAVTEIVYSLGEEGRLVARDTTSSYPEAALALPDVGYMRALSPEGVLSVSPTAILAAEGSGPPTTMAVLEKARVQLVLVPESHSGKGILEKIRVVGKALGVEDKAEALAERVGKELQEAETAATAAAGGRRVLFILSMQGGRILAAGSDTGADGIIRMAGGTNAVSGFSGYKQVSDEAIAEARPDVILMMDRGDGSGVSDADLFAHPAIAGTAAGANKALLRMDGSYLLGFGPRTASAVRDLSAKLHDVETATD
ncbi:hemin ABC transporter substrate-binding protein [Nitratireductor sp. ZSWI3]|uniref:heme/hemin ABC transporter substrate-binding protein n=1 Tax=Nitratireductor sp. ZSWI3 TaxID=2966359 RepID=UPI00214FAC82|nr:ABC transporter substrate-binding protein [Nitratireductor sp. ZSWI3]MCR4267970.1 ABC transporter substrate-binding protein [Nitratireductor sp. ZSWI3]